MKYGNVFWGIILITIGALFVLRNFGILDFSWYSIFRLWPLLLILWGISVLPVKAGIRVLLSLASVFVALAIVISNPHPHFRLFDWRWSDRDYEQEYEDEEWKEQHLVEGYDTSIRKVTLNLDAAAGDFYVRGETDQLFRFDSEGRTGKYRMKTREIDDTRIVHLSLEKIIHGGKITSTSHLSLNRAPVWDLNLDVGAAEMELDLTGFRTENVDIDGGAASIWIKLDHMVQKTEVQIDAGASSIRIEVPEEAACELRSSTILSAKDIQGFNKINRNLYQTPNFSDTVNQILIEVDAAVSSLEVIRY